MDFLGCKSMHQLDSLTAQRRVFVGLLRLADMNLGEVSTSTNPAQVAARSLTWMVRTHDGYVEIIQITPWFSFGIDYVDLLESKRPGVPHVGEHRAGLGAEPAVLAREESYATRLEETSRGVHGPGKLIAPRGVSLNRGERAPEPGLVQSHSPRDVEGFWTQELATLSF